MTQDMSNAELAEHLTKMTKFWVKNSMAAQAVREAARRLCAPEGATFADTVDSIIEYLRKNKFAYGPMAERVANDLAKLLSASEPTPAPAADERGDVMRAIFEAHRGEYGYSRHHASEVVRQRAQKNWDTLKERKPEEWACLEAEADAAITALSYRKRPAQQAEQDTPERSGTAREAPSSEGPQGAARPSSGDAWRDQAQYWERQWRDARTVFAQELDAVIMDCVTGADNRSALKRAIRRLAALPKGPDNG